MTQAANLTEAHSLQLGFKNINPTGGALKALQRWGRVLPTQIPALSPEPETTPVRGEDGCFLVQSQRGNIKKKKERRVGGWGTALELR